MEYAKIKDGGAIVLDHTNDYSETDREIPEGTKVVAGLMFQRTFNADGKVVNGELQTYRECTLATGEDVWLNSKDLVPA